MLPAAVVVAAEIEIAGVDVPVATLIGAEPVTLLTEAPAEIPSSLVLSVADMLPAALVVAAEIEIAGVVVSVATLIGAEPVTVVTVPGCAPAAMPSSLVLSEADNVPAALVVAAEIEIAGVVVPVATVIGAEPETLVTVPEPTPLVGMYVLSILVKAFSGTIPPAAPMVLSRAY
jgi:hypothetical protein